MTSTHQYETCSCSNSMAGAYEPEEESSIDLVLEEKKIVNTDATVPRMSDQLLNLFSQSAPTNIQLKEKSKVLGLKRHIIDFKMHLYHRSLRFPTIYQITFLYKLRDVINDDDEGSHWLKFLLQAIAYNDATHKKASDKVVTYKALAHKCKKKVRLSAQRLVDSKERFIAKEINNENLQTKLKDEQTQLANIHMQRKDNVATPTDTKHKQLQQQVKNMQSQLANAHAHHKDSMATTTDTMTMAAIWHPRSISLIKLLSGKIVDNYNS